MGTTDSSEENALSSLYKEHCALLKAQVAGQQEIAAFQAEVTTLRHVVDKGGKTAQQKNPAIAIMLAATQRVLATDARKYCSSLEDRRKQYQEMAGSHLSSFKNATSSERRESPATKAADPEQLGQNTDWEAEA